MVKTIPKNALAGDTTGPVDGTQSIRRALGIIRELAAGGRSGVRVTDVTRNTKMSHATVHRILQVLISEGIVEQNSVTRRYAIGEQLPLLALSRPLTTPVQLAAAPWLHRAAHEIGDTIFLTVRTGLDTLCVSRQLGDYLIQVLMIEIGARRPLGVSSAGMAILAAMPPAAAQDILFKNKDRLASYRMPIDKAFKVVEETRERGYAVRLRGLVNGTRSVSVAICESNTNAIAALTVTGVDHRLNNERICELASYLQESAKDIEHSLAKKNHNEAAAKTTDCKRN